jgi:hypothetical protein
MMSKVRSYVGRGVAALCVLCGVAFTQASGDEYLDEPVWGLSAAGNFLPTEDGHLALQFGITHTRPLLWYGALLLNMEGNILGGQAGFGDDPFKFAGVNVPLTVLLQMKRYVSIEAGVYGDAVFGVDSDDTVYMLNAGLVAGIGNIIWHKSKWRYYYRYCRGLNFSAHVVGLCYLL